MGGSGGGGVTSDVEDPRPALKDGGGVWRELGPHQMFLRGREREERRRVGVRQLWCSHPLRETRGERSVGVGVGGLSARVGGNLMVMQQKLTRLFCSNEEIRVAAF